MDLRVNAGTLLHPVEVDLLCVFAEVEAPFPLEIPASGQSDVEQRALFGAAREQLTERGLADESGPLGVAEDFVFLLRSCTGVVDMVLAKEDITLAAAVLVHRDEALLVTQDLASPERMLRMKPATLDAALDDLVRLVPRAEAPITAPFSLPRQALDKAFAALVERGEPLTAPEVDEVLRSQGIDDRVTRRMVSHLQPVAGSGQIGLARRDETEEMWTRMGEELRWLDTERGRFRLAGDAEWMSVNPLSRDDLRAEVRTMALRTR
ncbi:ESX secretion-associated protein EspG [Actinophytocola oryzae]|uniref:ESAT-6 protein secretion system EspG family protein n=1 Tax=Actinophytocola oryzae TaxID=502181 RepID=A0A4R7VDE3_9PSEU|nr:ESX secretion-associated protein EspG [Actinophytocola oryzae]TDV47163.1 ESAT-6 protein secretion system EspG family protein [Actinophytocola oryzae]